MRSLLVFLSLLLSFSLSAQNYTLKGVVSDAEKGEPLPGAHITLVDQNSGETQAQVSQSDGKFVFEAVKNGAYDLKVSFLGFHEFVQKVEVLGKSLDLGPLKLEDDFVKLETVQIVEQALPTMQKGDTTEMNAQAYKTMPDASAEDLINKMPTISVQDGKVQAQGESVKQVLVDGKPFFGNDPTAALRSLPADVIDKIQVFDQQSDQAQFTGFQDGETSKTINIITKPNMRAGQFGKLYAGYGHPDLYQTGGQVNIFNKNRRISLIGMSNNINQQNFASEDLLGVVGSTGGGGRGSGGGSRMFGGGGVSTNDFLVSQQGGITQTHALGVNYADKWGKKVDVSASYFFNWSDNAREQIIFREFASSGDFQEFYNEESLDQSTNMNHRINGRIEYKIDSSNSLIFRPQFSWQGNDGLSELFGKNLQGVTLLSETDNRFNAELTALSVNSNVLWRHNFSKARRTFSVYLSGGYAPKRGENSLLSTNIFYAGQQEPTILDQKSILESNNWNSAANLEYTEPVGKNSMVMLSYRGNYQQDDSDRQTFDFEESTQAYTGLNNLLSNIFSNDYNTHRLGTGYNWRKDKFMFVTRVFFQRADLINEQLFPEMNTIDRNFDNVLPFAMFRYEKSRTDNLSIFYRSFTRLPSIDQMQNVLNNSNPLQLSVGNPSLIQSLQHNFSMRYSKTNTERSSVLFLLLSGGFTQDHIATSTYLAQSDHPIFEQYEVAPGAQLSIPTNLDGYYNARSMVTYGFPIKPLKLNLNIDVSGNYTRTPGLINDNLNYSNNTNSGVGLTLSSNISETLDFSLSSRTNYNWVTNTLQTNRNSNFLSQTAQFRFNWIIWKGLTFRSDLTYQYFDGLSEEFNPNYWLWSMSLGKKILKNNRGEINLSVFDLLKQNTSLSRTITEVYVQDVQTNVLQRYVMLNFIYNLRNFGPGKK